jgi:streptogramin lyase
MNRSVWAVGLVAAAATAMGCGDDVTTGDVGEVTASVTLTATDVRCLSIKAVGSTTVTSLFNVQGQTTSVLSLTGLPVGSVTFTALAYSVICSSATTATYVSDPVTATLVAGTPANISFKMRSPSATGATTVTLDFPDTRGRVTEFMTWSGAPITSVAAGSDGNLWLAQANQGISFMSPDGYMVNQFTPVSPSFGGAYAINKITAGPDGNIWFTDDWNSYVGRISPGGTTKGFYQGGLPEWITAGPDGNLWFTDMQSKIGRVTPLGTITMFNVPTAASNPAGITAGPDGNLWFAETNTNKIGRVTPAGAFAEFTIPTANSYPRGIAAGADGNLWFVENSGNKVAKITTAGVITVFALPTAFSYPNNVVRGADGNIWVGCGAGAVLRVTPAGVITEYPAGGDSATVSGITPGPDGNMWFGVGGTVDRLKP